MKRLLVLLLAALPLLALGKAYFSPKKEMIQRAEAIAVVNITSVIETNVEPIAHVPGWEYRQKATAEIERSLKGGVKGTIEIYGMESFICAQCRYEKGKFLVFLRKENGRWIGSNWQPGIRPITGDSVSWLVKNDDAFDSKPAPLADVIAEIEAQVKQDAAAPVPTPGKP